MMSAFIRACGLSAGRLAALIFFLLRCLQCNWRWEIIRVGLGLNYFERSCRVVYNFTENEELFLYLLFSAFDFLLLGNDVCVYFCMILE